MHTPRENIISNNNNNNGGNNLQSPNNTNNQQRATATTTSTPNRGSLHGTPTSQQRNSSSQTKLYTSSNVAAATASAMMMNANNFGVGDASSPDHLSNSLSSGAGLFAPGSPASILLRSPPSKNKYTSNQNRSNNHQQRSRNNNNNNHARTGSNVSNMSSSTNNNNNNNNDDQDQQHPLFLSAASGDRFINNSNSSGFLSPTGHGQGNGANNNAGNNGNNNQQQDQLRFNLFSGAPRTYQRGMTRSRSPEENEKADEPYARLLQQTLLSASHNHQHNNSINNNNNNDDEDENDDRQQNLENNTTTNGGEDSDGQQLDSSLMSTGDQPPQGRTPNSMMRFDAENVLPRSSLLSSRSNNNNNNSLYAVESNSSSQANHPDPLHQRNIIYSNNVPSSRMGIVLPLSPPNNNNNSNGNLAGSSSPYSPISSPNTNANYFQVTPRSSAQQILFAGNINNNNLGSPYNNNNNQGNNNTSGQSTPASRLSYVTNSNNNNGAASSSPSSANNNFTTKGSLLGNNNSGTRNSAYYSSNIVDDDESARESAASLDIGFGGSYNNARSSYNATTGNSNNQRNSNHSAAAMMMNNNSGGTANENITAAESERFNWTLSSVYNANRARNFKSRAFRVIPQTPERILDAPDLLDDFYLHLLDWGSQNILAVALSHTLYLWNADSGDITQLMTTVPENQDSTNNANRRDEYITGLSWHPDGTKISVGLSNSEVQLWDTTTQQLERTYTGHTGRVGSLAWSQNVLASGGRDATIRLHDIRLSNSSGVFGLLKGHTQEVCGLSWSPCGRRLASGGNDNLVNIWDFPVRYSNGGNSSAGLGGSTAASSKRTTGAHSALDAAMNDNNSNDPLNSFLNGESGFFAASSGIEDGRPLMQLRRHVAAVKGLAWNPTRRGILATGGGTADKTLCFWDINAPVSTAVPTPINLLNNPSQLNQHPQSNLAHIHPSLAGSNPSAIQAHFSVVQTNPLHCVDTQSQICGVLWNKDGSEVVTSHGYSEHQLSLWKYPSLRRIADLTGHGARVLHLSMSPDGEVVVSAAADETIRFWRCFATTSRLANSSRVGESSASKDKDGKSKDDESTNNEDGENPNNTSRTSTTGSTRKSQTSRLNADDVDYEADWDLNLR